MCTRDMATGHTYTLVQKETIVQTSKGKLDAIVYNTMISVYAKAKDWLKLRNCGENSEKILSKEHH
jgi:hypothetical protein